jgi:hypothetical protein
MSHSQPYGVTCRPALSRPLDRCGIVRGVGTTDEEPLLYVSPLREVRRAVGLSIRGLEARSGVHRAVLSQVERGFQPSPSQARRIAEALAAAAREGGEAA